MSKNKVITIVGENEIEDVKNTNEYKTLEEFYKNCICGSTMDVSRGSIS
jgi:hypothetical protein